MWRKKTIYHLDLVVTSSPTTSAPPVIITTTSPPPRQPPPSSSLNHTITHPSSTGIRLEEVENRVPVPIPTVRDGCRADDQVRCFDGSEIYIWLITWKNYIFIFLFSLFTFILPRRSWKNWFSIFFSFFSHEKILLCWMLFTFDMASYSIFAAADLLLPLYSSDEFCDGIKNCPGGEDEDPRKCSGIPFIFAFLFIYFNLFDFFYRVACFFTLQYILLLMLLFRVFACRTFIQKICMKSQQSEVNVFTEEW